MAAAAAKLTVAARLAPPAPPQIRFTRMGRKKLPFYRIIAVDSRVRRDGAPLEYLGWYNPLNKEANLNAPAIKKWLSGARGAVAGRGGAGHPGQGRAARAAAGGCRLAGHDGRGERGGSAPRGARCSTARCVEPRLTRLRAAASVPLPQWARSRARPSPTC